MGIQEISCNHADDLLKSNKIFLLDVRESVEFDFSSISNSHNIPMSEISSRLSELPQDGSLIGIICHHGSRSMGVCVFLEKKKYQVCNIKGGIDAWSIDVDSSVPRYILR